MRSTRFLVLAALGVFLTAGIALLFLLQGTAPSFAHADAETPNVAVGAQYDSTHVLVPPEDFDRFVSSVLATLGGTSTAKQAATNVTPTPSSTMLQMVFTSAGTLSVFGFTTPVPYPFGSERTGYLLTDMDVAISAARTAGANVLVTSFNDPIGKDAIIQFPGGVNTQLYWHTTAPSYAPLQNIPENRVYVSADKADAFIRSFLAFSHGKVTSEDMHAPGVEIGRPADNYRQIRIQSKFGKLVVLVTDGHLPYPYGREITGYEVANLSETVAKAKAAGVSILVAPYSADQRNAALVQFPGGYIAEIHSPIGK